MDSSHLPKFWPYYFTVLPTLIVIIYKSRQSILNFFKRLRSAFRMFGYTFKNPFIGDGQNPAFISHILASIVQHTESIEKDRDWFYINSLNRDGKVVNVEHPVNCIVQHECRHEDPNWLIPLMGSEIMICKKCQCVARAFGVTLNQSQLLIIQKNRGLTGNLEINLGHVMRLAIDSNNNSFSYWLIGLNGVDMIRTTIEVNPRAEFREAFPNDEKTDTAEVNPVSCNHPAQAHDHERVNNEVFCRKCNSVIMRNGIVLPRPEKV